MYPITDEVKALFDAEEYQVLRVTGVDRNGIPINISNKNILQNGFNIDRFSNNGEKLEIGTAIAAEMTLKLDNRQGQFNGVVFEGTELFAEIGVAGSDAITGVNTNALTVPVTSERFAYKWRCVVAEDGDSVTSEVASISNLNGESFAILKQPASVVALDGQTVTFSVSAIGNGLTYQWQQCAFNDTTWVNSQVSGSNTDTISIVASVDWGLDTDKMYRCVVTDADNNAIVSEGAGLHTYVTTPTINYNPASVSANVGAIVVFNVTAFNSDATYQWQYSSDNGSTWNDIETTFIPCGYFTCYEQPRTLSTITIHALDRMMRFDDIAVSGQQPWTDNQGNEITDNLGNTINFVTGVSLPATIADFIAALCNRYSVPLGTTLSGLPNSNYTISEIPSSQTALTFRTMIAWCAGIMGTNAWINWDGKLCFSWYDNNTGYVTEKSNRYSSDLFESDITITGVTWKESDDAQSIHVAGNTTYAIDMSDNGLIDATVADAIIRSVYWAVHDYVYRPFSASVVNAPYLWPMDRIVFVDRDGNGHVSMLTNVNFGINGDTVLEARGQTSISYSRPAPTVFTAQQQNVLSRIQRSNNEDLKNAVDRATALITGADGGYVRFMYDANDVMTEILIMDTDDITTATKVWRWNSGGLGYSSNGYAGPYTTAITQNGEIVANFITTGALSASLITTGVLNADLITAGHLSADRISTGVIMALAGGSYFNLNTGVIYSEGEVVTADDPEYTSSVKVYDGDVYGEIEGDEIGYVGARRLYGVNPNTSARFLDSTAIRIGLISPSGNPTQAIELIQDGAEDFQTSDCGIRLDKNNSLWIKADHIYLGNFDAYDRNQGNIDPLASGSFRTADNKLVLVENGLITNIT